MNGWTIARVNGSTFLAIAFPPEASYCCSTGTFDFREPQMESVPHTAEPLWRPHPEQIQNSNLARFRAWLRENRSLDFDDSQSLFQWSVGDLEAFWSAISEYFDVRFTTAAEAVLLRDPDPVNTKWFPGGRLNYAEHLLRFGSSRIGAEDDRPAILFFAEPDIPGGRQVLTRAELVDRVNRVATAMRRFGVQQGDRVAGYTMERRSQRRLLAGQPAAAVLPGDYRSGLSLRGAQRRGAAAGYALALVVDEAHDRPAQALPRVRPRHAGVSLAGE
jgi:hypothetical protein